MMTRNQSNEREQLEMLTIDQLVPDDHLVRKLESAIDFLFIYPLVKNLYSEIGRPSIDPIVLFKMIFIQYIFGIRSMRQTIKEIETNMAYRWFLGFGFHTIERVFAYAKEKHGMRWTTLRGAKKIVYAGDAYFCCHEFKEISDLDMASCLMWTHKAY
jgi:transposase